MKSLVGVGNMKNNREVNLENQEEENRDEKKKRVFLWLWIFIFLMLLVFGVFTATYSMYLYTGDAGKDNEIETGGIIFNYSDAIDGNNGISIDNAHPISDEIGKILSGSREYFDFNISSKSKTTDLAYEITISKSDDSDLDEKYVKIYLTTFDGGIEKPVDIIPNTDEVITYDKLSNTNNSLLGGKVIFSETIEKGTESYEKKFRIRMWIADTEDNNDILSGNRKKFSIKVNVAAVNK